MNAFTGCALFSPVTHGGSRLAVGVSSQGFVISLHQQISTGPKSTELRDIDWKVPAFPLSLWYALHKVLEGEVEEYAFWHQENDGPCGKIQRLNHAGENFYLLTLRKGAEANIKLRRMELASFTAVLIRYWTC